MSATATVHSGDSGPLTKVSPVMPMRSLRARLASGAIWSLIGTLLSRGATLVASIFVARMIGKDQFGKLGIIQNTASMIQVFAGFGLGLTASKYVAGLKNTDPARAGRVVTLSAMVAWALGSAGMLALAIGAPWIAKNTLSAPSLTGELRISSLLVLLGAVNGAQVGALAGFEAFRPLAFVNTVAGLCSFPFMLIGSRTGGLHGAVWALVATMALNAILNNFVLRRAAAAAGVSLGISGALRESAILWKFSLPAVLSGLMVVPVNWLCGAVLVNQPNGYSEMGIYSAANQWRNAILMVPALLASVTVALLASMHAEHDTRRFRKLLGYEILINAFCTIAIGSAVLLVSKRIMSSYGPSFRAGTAVLLPLVLSAVFHACNATVGNAIASTGRMWHGFALNALWAITTLGLAVYLIPLYGALGLAWSSAGAYGMHTIWQLCYVLRITAHPTRSHAIDNMAPTPERPI